MTNYTESVTQHADEDGLLDEAVVLQLLQQHGLEDTVADVKMDLGDEWNEADVFMAWLGY